MDETRLFSDTHHYSFGNWTSPPFSMRLNHTILLVIFGFKEAQWLTLDSL
jgi:hypothetical protein